MSLVAALAWCQGPSENTEIYATHRVCKTKVHASSNPTYKMYVYLTRRRMISGDRNTRQYSGAFLYLLVGTLRRDEARDYDWSH